MGSPKAAALLLPLLLLLICPSISAGIGCPYLPHWITRCLLLSHVDKSFTDPHPVFHCNFWFPTWKFCPNSMPYPVGPSLHKALVCSDLALALLFVSASGILSCRPSVGLVPLPDAEIQKALQAQVLSETQDASIFSGPDFSFDLLPKARAIRVTIPPGPEASIRLCHQWALECEELSIPFAVQKIVSGGHTADLPYEFLLPCLCIEASYLQEDSVRRKKCPFHSLPEAYGSDFWKSAHFTDYSQHNQMAMALTLRCPLKLEASLCQRQDLHSPCEDLPNSTARESEGWYVLEEVDLHPYLCFKFSFENSSHVECPHKNSSLISWNVSMDIQAQQLILHFSSRMHASFSAAWSHQGLGPDTLMPPVYSVSQTQGSGPVTLDLIMPFLRPGGCILVWRSDVQFAWKHLLCPNVSNRRLGLLTLALLSLTTLLVIVLVFTCRRLLSGPSHARPVLLLHAADSEAQRRLVGALAELLRTALGCRRDVIVDLWEGTRMARVGPLPWLWAAQARVVREQGTVLLLWSGAGPSLACGPYTHAVPLSALLCAAPRPLLLLVYFSRLCAKGDIPQPLRALPRYRLLRDLPRLLRALDTRPSTQATSWNHLRAQQCFRGRLELCRRLELEATKLGRQGSAEVQDSPGRLWPEPVGALAGTLA